MVALLAATALWATVNVCDTPAHPDTIGIRASMPGTPRRARASMRFSVQYRTPAGWRAVRHADSGWRRVGTTHGAAIESGSSFHVQAPARPGELRGVVRLRRPRPD